MLTKTVVQVEGLKELDAKLKQLEGAVAKRIARKGLRAGAKIVLKQARANAPVKSGKLKKGLAVQGGGRVRGGWVAIKVMVSKKALADGVYYGPFQEFGWRAGKRTKEIRRYQDLKRRFGDAVTPVEDKRRQVPGKHFVERAFEATVRSAIDAIVATVRKEITKAVAAPAGFWDGGDVLADAA